MDLETREHKGWGSSNSKECSVNITFLYSWLSFSHDSKFANRHSLVSYLTVNIYILKAYYTLMWNPTILAMKICHSWRWV